MFIANWWIHNKFLTQTIGCVCCAWKPFSKIGKKYLATNYSIYSLDHLPYRLFIAKKKGLHSVYQVKNSKFIIKAMNNTLFLISLIKLLKTPIHTFFLFVLSTSSIIRSRIILYTTRFATLLIIACKRTAQYL